MPLETESTLRIRSLIQGFRPNNGDLLGALHTVQHEFGYLSHEALKVIADLGQCNGTCELAPMVWIEQKSVYEHPVGNLTAAKSIKIARALSENSDVPEALND